MEQNSEYKTKFEIEDNRDLLGKPQQQKGIIIYIKEKQYILWALAAAICFAVHNYSVAYAQFIWKDQNVFIVLPEGFTWLLYYSAFHLVSGYKRKTKCGQIWRKEDSAFYDKLTSKFNYGSVGLLVLRSFLSSMMTLIIAGIMYFSKEAGVSPSVVFSITSLSSFTTALAFYILYGERLTIKHIAGMTLIMASVVIIAISKTLSQSTKEAELQSFEKVLIPIALSLFFCCCVTSSGIALRNVVKRGYNPLQFAIDFTAMGGIYYLIGFTIFQTNWNIYTTSQIIYIQFSAFVIMSSFIFQNMAIMTGKGGLAIAIIQSQSFIQFIFEISIQRRIPSFFEVIALICGIGGSFIIVLSKK